MISSPLRSRFSGGVFRLEFYTDNEIQQIIDRSAGILSINLTQSASAHISKRSRKTPRTANYLLKRCRDLAQIHNKDLDEDVVLEALDMVGTDSIGLNKSDISLLETIIHKYNGGPVGLSTIAASLSEDEATVEDFNEPYLIQLGFIGRTPRGRVATEKAYDHLGIAYTKHE
jgi:Holliday junction DNA helicase RuvB